MSAPIFKDLEGKVALVTGASSGIGRATAVRYAHNSVRLALTGRDASRLQDTARRCVEAGLKTSDVLTVIGDVTKPKEVDVIVNKTIEHFGHLDILVNCAGQIKAGMFMTTKMADYDSLFDSNLRAAFIVTKAAVEYIIERKGCIINISSFTGIRPCSTYFSYGLAGAALDQFTKAMALELGPKGVRVNSVNPGIVTETSLWTRAGAPFEKMPKDKFTKLFEDLRQQYPIGRLAGVDDVTPAIMYLSSSQASMVTGVILPVDGGKVLTSKGAVDLVAPKSM